jgi:hypothetical protein
MKKSVNEWNEDEPFSWQNRGEDVTDVISDILEDSIVTIQIIEALELRMRRLEQLSNKKAVIILNHEENKLYITVND